MWLVLAAIATFGAFVIYAWRVPQKVAPADIWVVTILVMAMAAMCISQIFHFALYAAGREPEIHAIAALVAVIAPLATIGLTIQFNIVGTAMGLLVGAIALTSPASFGASKDLPGMDNRAIDVMLQCGKPGHVN